MKGLLVSLDVGGTLGHADGPGLAGLLATASPLPAVEARRIMRNRLHNQPALSETVIANLCKSLRIPVDAFPRNLPPAPLILVPGAIAALEAMAAYARLVTLSNVTCVEADTDALAVMLHPWVTAFYPSCAIGVAKPDPAAFAAVAAAHGTTTAGLVHIGDDWECDIDGARDAGATAIWISHGRAVPKRDRIVDPDVRVAVDLAAAAAYVTDLAIRRKIP